MTTPEPADDLALPGRGVVTRWSLRLAAAVMLVGGVVLIFLLVQATNNRLLYERYFARLLWINIAAATVLALVILWGVFRLLSRLRPPRKAPPTLPTSSLKSAPIPGQQRIH